MIYATQQMDKEKLKQKGKVLRVKGVYASLSLLRSREKTIDLHCKVFGRGVERALTIAPQPWRGGEGGNPLYKLYKYVPPHRVGFLRRFDLKTGMHFAHFGLELGMVFEGSTGFYERLYRFNSK